MIHSPESHAALHPNAPVDASARVRAWTSGPRSTPAFLVWGLLAGLLHCAAMFALFPEDLGGGLSPVVAMLAPLVALVPLCVVGLLAGQRAEVLRAAGLRGGLKRTAGMAAVGSLPFWTIAMAFVRETSRPGYPALCLYLALHTMVWVWIVGAWSRARAEARARTELGCAPGERPAGWHRWSDGVLRGIPGPLALGMLWTAVEYLRSQWVFSGFPFFGIGHATIDLWGGALPNPAMGFGGFAPGLILACLSVAIAEEMAKRASPRRAVMSPRPSGPRLRGHLIRWTVPAAALLVLSGVSGLTAPTAQHPGLAVRVALLQTNLPISNRAVLPPAERELAMIRWASLSLEAATADPPPHLIVWPETMFPAPWPAEMLDAESVRRVRESGLVIRTGNPPDARALPLAWFAHTLLDLTGQTRVPLLVGAIAADNLRFNFGADQRLDPDSPRTLDARYNSAILIRDGQILTERYDKRGLMGFGEYIPVLWRWPGLQRWLVGASGADFEMSLGFGRSASLLRIPVRDAQTDLVIAAPICIESGYADLCRRLAHPGNDRHAQLLVNISNDGWFYRDRRSREAFLLLARWRSVELGLPTVRAVNTGISAFISAEGRVVKRGVDGSNSDWDVEGLLTGQVHVHPPGYRTLYARIGEVLPWSTLVGSGVIVAALVLNRRRTDRSSTPA